MQEVIVSTYKNLADSETVAFAIRVVDKMENNPDFPDAPPALAAAKKLVPEALSAIGNAKGRDVEAVALKNRKKEELIALLTELAGYVTAKSNGDRLKLLSSGFFTSGGNGNVQDPVITQLEVELGAAGEATISVKRVRNARAYMHQFTTEPPTATTVWASAGSKQAFYTFSGLTSMARYWFRVVAIARYGEIVTSPVVTKVIQ